jgi:hypothetical protein
LIILGIHSNGASDSPSFLLVTQPRHRIRKKATSTPTPTPTKQQNRKFTFGLLSLSSLDIHFFHKLRVVTNVTIWYFFLVFLSTLRLKTPPRCFDLQIATKDKEHRSQDNIHLKFSASLRSDPPVALIVGTLIHLEIPSPIRSYNPYNGLPRCGNRLEFPQSCNQVDAWYIHDGCAG